MLISICLCSASFNILFRTPILIFFASGAAPRSAVRSLGTQTDPLFADIPLSISYLDDIFLKTIPDCHLRRLDGKCTVEGTRVEVKCGR